MNIQGVYTALVTPMRNGEVDYAVLRDLVEMQIAGNVAGIVPVGTTGESPTLTYDEHAKVIETVIEVANHRCQIIAGTGANCTREAIEMTKHAAEAGADGLITGIRPPASVSIILFFSFEVSAFAVQAAGLRLVAVHSVFIRFFGSHRLSKQILFGLYALACLAVYTKIAFDPAEECVSARRSALIQ